MIIKKENILKAFEIFNNTYMEFEKRIQDTKKLHEMIETWEEVFKILDFDYEYANKDFLKAVTQVITRNKFVPTIAEIIEEMKKINANRIKEKNREQLWAVLSLEDECNLKNSNLDKTLALYSILKENYSDNKIIGIIKKYRKENDLNNEMILNTENILEKIMR